MKQNRFKRRMWHNLLLATVSSFLLILFYVMAESDHMMFRLSMTTGYTGLILIGITLMIGPFNILRGKNNPVSTDLRRDTGIWGGIISLAHVVFGIQVHMGNIWLYFFREVGEAKEWVLRYDFFGFANYTGLIATLIILLLLLLSNDLSLRWLKKTKWKALQRFNYGLLALIFVHGIMYQVIENRNAPFVVLLAGIALIILIIQVYGYWSRKHEKLIYENKL